MSLSFIVYLTIIFSYFSVKILQHIHVSMHVYQTRNVHLFKGKSIKLQQIFEVCQDYLMSPIIIFPSSVNKHSSPPSRLANFSRPITRPLIFHGFSQAIAFYTYRVCACLDSEKITWISLFQENDQGARTRYCRESGDVD